MVKQDQDGTVLFNSFGKGSQTSNLPMIATEEDTGPLVHALLQVPPGKNLIGVRKWMQMEKFAEMFGKVMGVPTKMSDEGFSKDGFPEDLREEFSDTIGYTAECGYDGGKVDKSVVQPDELGVEVKLGSVEEWIAKQDWSGVLEERKE